jgi:hypothetical protein
MPNLKRKYLRIVLISTVSLLIIAIIGGYIAYSKREALLQKVIAKVTLKAKNDYNLDVKIGSEHFTALNEVAFDKITVHPFQRDSLLTIANFKVKVKLLPLLFGDVKFSKVMLRDARLNLTSIKGVKNFDFLFKKKQDTIKSDSKVDLSAFAHQMMNQILYKIPDDLDLKNFEVNLQSDDNHLNLLVVNATIADGKLSSVIKVDTTAATWHMAGRMQPSDRQMDIRLYAEGRKVELPVLEKKFGLKLNFDTIETQLINEEHRNGETRIKGSWSVKNLLINHAKVAANNIVVEDAAIDAQIVIGSNFVSIDSTSVVHLKKISIKPFIKYTLNPDKVYELKFRTDWMDAQEVFDSFPEGLFESLSGTKVAGKLKYAMDFKLDSKDPDSVIFISGLSKQDFKILQFGKTDLSKINKEFVYTPYEYGKPMRPIVVGPSNANFTPLASISKNLKDAVMTAEDPSFFSHKGFVEESIRKSIATNFKEKSFKRGGSTISMQLVKNVFLSRQKTLSRKIEEILIVWLIENNDVIAKSRMLEVYFNIIEWGRNVYGVGEAAHYYFGKSASELNIGESIYLASIVPKPKSGLYAFAPDGGLKGYLHGYFNFIGNIMAKRGLIPSDSSAYGFYNVRLRESLRQQIAPDTAITDSLMIDGDDEDGNGLDFFERLFNNNRTDTLVQKQERAVITPADTVRKSARELRQEKREERKREREKKNELNERGLF